MKKHSMRFCLAVPVLSLVLMTGIGTTAAERTPDEYLQIVVSYADAMLKDGRDTYGQLDTPLLATTLDRKTGRLLEGEELKRVAEIPRESWGIRAHDRMLSGSNPMHDQNLYQVLYALSKITGEGRYAEAADGTLKWFFEHCQSEETSLLAWGEHIGWDFYTEKAIDKKGGMTHEYFRPWILWERSFRLAPEACAAFATGVWEHQIGDRETGNFSRHAQWHKHGPGTNSEYPRHGGFYIATWAHAYKQTQDLVYRNAIETLVDYFERRRNSETGAIPSESAERSKGKVIWPPSNLSLAVDLQDGALCVPESLAEKMRRCAAKTDRVFLSLPNDLGKDGKGFVWAARADTLAMDDAVISKWRSYSRTWATGYGEQTDAGIANLCLLRYRQVPLEGYKRLVVETADRYLDSEPIIEFPVYPGTLGDVIFLLTDTYELTNEEKYLKRADHFARAAIDLFLTDGSPLPRATTQHNHYEAITRGDTLMMALMKLWAVQHGKAQSIRLIYSDR